MKRGKIFALIAALLFLLTACTPEGGSLTIVNGSECSMYVGETLQLECKTENLEGEVTWSVSGGCVSVDEEGLVTAKFKGAAVVSASLAPYSDSVRITVSESLQPSGISLSVDRDSIFLGERATLSAKYLYDGEEGDEIGSFTYSIVSGIGVAALEGNSLLGISTGSVSVTATDGTRTSDPVTVTVAKPNESPLLLSVERDEIYVGESVALSVRMSDSTVSEEDIGYRIVEGNACAELNGNLLTGRAAGTVKVIAVYGETESNAVLVTVMEAGDTFTLRADKYYIVIGESTELRASAGGDVSYEATVGGSCTTLNGSTVTGRSLGETTFVARRTGAASNEITVAVVQDGAVPKSVTLSTDRETVPEGESATLSYKVTPSSAAENIVFRTIEGSAELYEDLVVPEGEEAVTVIGIIGGVASNAVTINAPKLTQDPYMDVDETDFYRTYTPAESAEDAEFRSAHSLMSGDISEQDQRPTDSDFKPMVGGLYVRNTAAVFSADGSTYYVFGSDGEVAGKVYKEGAYVTLEEVAVYLFAFGDVPKNYISGRSGSPSSSPWRKYLRLNHSAFSGNTSQYPYEPVLPDISGAGGSLYYYEVDIGTTGTDCDPNYTPENYNDGSRISRGAARIVYTRYDANEDPFTDVNEKYLFYTYNHYNDFQEYLNYRGGWGEMFGNITGGGTISSKTHYNPTPYVDVIRNSIFDLI